MSGPSIKVTRDFYAIRVFINDLLHVWVPVDKLIGMETWCDTDSDFSIEFALAGGSMHLEYTDRDRWAMIVSGLEGVL